MKHIAWTILAGLLALSGRAAELTWQTDLPKAQQQAQQEKKMVLMNFTGSDWCGWCMKLKREVFDTPEFAKYAKDNLVLVEVDFPRRKKQDDKLRSANDALKQKYRAEGFPTIVVLNGQGKEVWHQVGYLPGGSKTWIEKLSEARKK